MTAAWESATVGDVSVLVTKGTTPTSLGGVFTNEGVRFVKVESLTHSGTIDHRRVKFVDEETHRKLLKRSILQAGDLLFSIAGTIGRVARVHETDLPANTNQAVAIIRIDPTRVTSEFLYYCLRDVQRIDRARTRVVQSVQQNLSLAELSRIEVPLPPLWEQRAIAATLGALDGRIESNRQLSLMIPELIRACVTHALDDGSKQIPVSSLASFVNGGAFTKGASGTGRMVLRIAELNSGPGGSTVYNDIEVPEDKTARAGDILMSWSGSLGVYRWARGEAIINQHIFKVIPTGYPAWLVYDRVEAVIKIFQAIARDKATTMGHIQRGHLDTTLIGVPPDDAIQRIDAQVGPLWERLLLAEQETLKLAALRDTLLPELLSGRVRTQEEVA